jgi:3-dehydroshikimate dehydratase
MISPGLTSVTFRKLAVPEIVALAGQARLKGIEWGGDVHVPHGDLAAARSAKAQTIDAGLAVSSYGSYFRAGDGDTSYEPVLETARALGAPVIRVWAGRKGSDAADAAYRAAVVKDLQRIGELSASAGIRVACEYHGGSLTDSTDATMKLMAAVGHPNVGMYWQPKPELGVEYGLKGIVALAPHLVNVHVFHWTQDGRQPLADGASDWALYLEAIKATGREHWLLLEFTRGDAPVNFLADARALMNWFG